jgi:hypothetical protein
MEEAAYRNKPFNSLRQERKIGNRSIVLTKAGVKIGLLECGKNNSPFLRDWNIALRKGPIKKVQKERSKVIQHICNYERREWVQFTRI